MLKTYTISKEEAISIRKRMKSVKNVHSHRRLEVLALLGEGKSPKEVAEIKNYHEKYVRTLRSQYCREGIDRFLCDGRKGGNNVILNKKEAQAFLSEFKEKAKAGQIITIEEIAKAYDERTKTTRKSFSSVYKFLHRNGWRKVMPRSKHPNKASEEAIEASKKLTFA